MCLVGQFRSDVLTGLNKEGSLVDLPTVDAEDNGFRVLAGTDVGHVRSRGERLTDDSLVRPGALSRGVEIQFDLEVGDTRLVDDNPYFGRYLCPGRPVYHDTDVRAVTGVEGETARVEFVGGLGDLFAGSHVDKRDVGGGVVVEGASRIERDQRRSVYRRFGAVETDPNEVVDLCRRQRAQAVYVDRDVPVVE